MQNLEIYREFYFKEIDRKANLDNSMNLPILILSICVSVQAYIFTCKIHESFINAYYLLSVLSFISGIYTVFYLIKCFSNFFKNYSYIEIAGMDEYFDFEKKLLAVKSLEISEHEFEAHLKRELATCAGHNFRVNIVRTEDLARSKKGMFYLITFTLIFFLIYLLSNISIMSQEEQKPKPESAPTTSEVKVDGPKSVHIQNSKHFKDKGEKK